MPSVGIWRNTNYDWSDTPRHGRSISLHSIRSGKFWAEWRPEGGNLGAAYEGMNPELFIVLIKKEE